MLGEHPAVQRFYDLRQYIVTHMTLEAVETPEPRQRREVYSDGRNRATVVYFDEQPVEIVRPGMETVYGR